MNLNRQPRGRRLSLANAVRAAVLVAAGASLAGCVYYPSRGGYAYAPSSYGYGYEAPVAVAPTVVVGGGWWGGGWGGGWDHDGDHGWDHDRR
ncbi:MAG: hypothetical protein B7Z80_23910 [Rhodospirillales bacterium 20-64-7]|nr:MAG: hypothetical protein B7Z80_23910 [Rhodospirillales bacterium 20-64-7]